MDKMFSIPHIFNILVLFVLCLLINTPIQAQDYVVEYPDYYSKYREAKKLPCGQRDDAIKFGKLLIEYFKDDDDTDNKKIVDFIKSEFPKIEEQEQICKNADSLETLYNEYRAAKKSACGERDKAVFIGKRILELYDKDKNSDSIFRFIEKDVPNIEQKDLRCRREKLYNDSYKSKNWSAFVEISKELIVQEGNNPLALDLMLTLVAVGYDRAAIDKVDTYDTDTLYYAKLAIQKIEAGKLSKTGKWGVFEPFNSKIDALCWMNYIIGWQMFNKLNQKKEALGYFYKSTQLGSEKKNDISIYFNIGNYYFDEAGRLFTELKDKRKANNDQDSDETRALLALVKGNAERALGAFGRAYKIAMQTKQNKVSINTLRRLLTDLYFIRYQVDMDKYVDDLIVKPMPDPATPVELILEQPAKTKTPLKKGQ